MGKCGRLHWWVGGWGGRAEKEEEGKKGEKPIYSPPCCTFNKSVRGYNEPLFTGCLNNTCAALPETRFCRPLAPTLAPPYIPAANGCYFCCCGHSSSSSSASFIPPFYFSTCRQHPLPQAKPEQKAGIWQNATFATSSVLLLFCAIMFATRDGSLNF